MSTEDLTALPPAGIETRWFSAENFQGERGKGGMVNGGRKGSPAVSLAAGATHILAELLAGYSGTVCRIWLTIDDRSPEMLRGMLLQAFWNGSDTPAISAPLGEFFGHMCGQMRAFESAFFGSPEGRSFWCTLPMPFCNGMRLTLTNTTERDLTYLFYDVNVTIGEIHSANTGYLHAIARRENPTTLQQDYAILPTVLGRGRFLGVHVGAVADQERYGQNWWGEGEAKFYIDDDTEFPTLCGTGTEDYIATGWGQGSYSQKYHGCPLADDPAMTYGFYRWHVPDPIYFHKSLRVTMQQIGHCFGKSREWLHQKVTATGEPIYAAGPGLVSVDLSSNNPAGGILFERQDDWSSVAFFLLDKPAIS